MPGTLAPDAFRWYPGANATNLLTLVHTHHPRFAEDSHG